MSAASAQAMEPDVPLADDDDSLAGDTTANGDVWSVTHELVNYLSAITTYASLLTDELEVGPFLGDQRLHDDAAQILAAAKHARSLGAQLSAITSAIGRGT